MQVSTLQTNDRSSLLISHVSCSSLTSCIFPPYLSIVVRPDGTYFYIGWNQNQFTGLHEDDFEISDFLGIDPDSEEAVDCLMMGEINYYQS